MLFANSKLMGTFKGFNERGLEFAAEIVAPYDSTMLERPQLGQFVLIELGSQDEAALGRITRFVPSGLLATPEGEDYVNTMQRRNQPVPEDLKTQRLKYRVQIKLLGAVRATRNEITYVPSQRRLPHLGARVALPSDAVLQELCKLSGGTTELGTYVLGEFNYCGTDRQQDDRAMLSMNPRLTVYFDVGKLVARRTFVFARAGYGKSNLIKLLISELYREQPMVRGVPVGTLIFDADGEYFWPDASGRPGLADVPHMQQRLVVFTNRKPRSRYYGSWKAGEVKLDLRALSAHDVVSIAVAPERQQQQNVLKLKALSSANWSEMVNLIYNQGLNASDADVGRLLGYNAGQVQQNAAEIAAARSNMYSIVRLLHDPNSLLLNGTLNALKDGCVVVVDISLLSSAAGEMLAGLILRKIFSHNQENFTGGTGVIPVVAVIEEAQSVLGRHLDDASPFVEWVKEGRKYDLGAVMITQQPGSMAPELLSQGDNWFAFHLLSESDAQTLRHHNAHYSDDILAHLISEPIRGNCFMWSAPHQPFVLPVRVSNFSAIYQGYINGDETAEPVDTYVRNLHDLIPSSLSKLAEALKGRLRNASFHEVWNERREAQLGIKDGHLYYLIKEIKDPTDPTPEQSLKEPVLKQILGSDSFEVIRHGQDVYYSASRQAWRRALGTEPRVRSNVVGRGQETIDTL